MHFHKMAKRYRCIFNWFKRLQIGCDIYKYHLQWQKFFPAFVQVFFCLVSCRQIYRIGLMICSWVPYISSNHPDRVNTWNGQHNKTIAWNQNCKSWPTHYPVTAYEQSRKCLIIHINLHVCVGKVGVGIYTCIEDKKGYKDSCGEEWGNHIYL